MVKSDLGTDSKSILLEVNKVTKRFEGLEALSEVSFEINSGRIHGLIGPNGAGKTTMFNLITGVLPATKGKILFQDHDVTELRPYEITRLGIARTFQNVRLFKNMTVWESTQVAQNVQLASPLSWVNPGTSNEEKRLQERARELLDYFGLGEKRERKCSELPYADQRRVEVVRALATEPDLLLLDEPTAGMTRTEVNEYNQRIQQLVNEEGETILLIEHNMDLAMNCCHVLTVLNFGEKIAEGSPSEIQKDEQVIEAYLGEEADGSF